MNDTNKNHKSILLVEDEAIIAQSTMHELEKYGYKVYPVYRGEDAIQIVCENSRPVDLILMDIDLGRGMDGARAAEKILEIHEVPILFLSSHTEAEIAAKTEKITSYGYVIKTSGIRVLDASIKMAFRLFEAKQKISDLALFPEENENPVFRVTPDSVLMYANRASRKIFINNPDVIPGEKIGSEWHEMVSSIWKNGESIQSLIELGGRQIVFNVVPVIEKNYINVYATDISEQRKAELHLKETEKRYSSIVNNSILGIVVMKDLKILFCNKKFAESLGYSTDEIYAMSRKELPKLVHPDDMEKLNGNYIARFSGKKIPHVYPVRYIHRDGHTLWFEISVDIIEYDGKKAVQAYFLDISERIKTDESLKQSEERFRRLADNARDMIYRMSVPEGIYEYVSPASEIVSGYKPEEYYRNPLFIRDIFHPDWREYLNAKWEDCKKGIVPPVFEYKIIHREKGERWIKQNNVNILDNEGNTIAIEGIISDITEQKTYEEKLNYRINAEHLLSEASLAVANADSGSMDTIIESVLQKTAEFCGASRCSFYRFNPEKDNIAKIYEWAESPEEAVPEELADMPVSRFKWHRNNIKVSGRSFISRMSDYPLPEAADEITWAEKFGFRPILLAGLFIRNSLAGLIGLFGKVNSELEWPDFFIEAVHSIGILIINSLERKKAEDAARETLRQNQNLLAELQHRAKNSFYMISSMIFLASESKKSRELKTVLDNLKAKTDAVSKMYDLLYSTNSVSRINLDQYLEMVASSIPLASNRIIIEKDLENVTMQTKNAISVGIVAAELLTNAVKYAFPGRKKGKVLIKLKKTGKFISLEISDNGKGFPADFKIENADSLGLKLVQTLAEQLQGSLKLATRNGAVCILRILADTEEE